MASEEETTGTSTEVEETAPVSTPSEEAKESSSDDTGSEEKDAKTPESEKPEDSKEESFEEAVNRMAKDQAKSIADKSTQTITRDRDSWKGRAEKAELGLNEKIYNLASNDMFGEEETSLGEEDATKRKEARNTRNKAVLEFQKNDGRVKATLAKLGDVDLDTFLSDMSKYHPVKTLEEAKSHLNDVVKHYMVSDKLRKLFFPEDKEKLETIAKHLEKFDLARDEKDVDVLLEGIRQGLKGKKFVADSGQQGAPGGIDLSTLSIKDRADALFKIAHEKKNKK